MGVSTQSALAWTARGGARPAAVSARLAARGVRARARRGARCSSELLGRPPLWPEAVLFGILWSEHCSYKSTRHLLRGLPTEAPQVILGPGEDAGVVSLPVAVRRPGAGARAREPQSSEPGAAGRGRRHRRRRHRARRRLHGRRSRSACSTRCASVIRAIRAHVRDVDARRGAGHRRLRQRARRAEPRRRRGVRRGFDANCLVNVMAVGWRRRDGILRSRVPEGPGPWVFVLVGKPTDESGFGGAAFASGELGDGRSARRGAVARSVPQARAARRERRGVSRACASAGLRAGFKDLGAGGIACATERARGGRRAWRGDRARATCTASTRAIPPEVLLCAETQERFCWVVPETFAARAVRDLQP